jgi:hypothetical protein
MLLKITIADDCKQLKMLSRDELVNLFNSMNLPSCVINNLVSINAITLANALKQVDNVDLKELLAGINTIHFNSMISEFAGFKVTSDGDIIVAR